MCNGGRPWVQKSNGVGERESSPLGQVAVRMDFMKDLVVGRNLEEWVKF